MSDPVNNAASDPEHLRRLNALLEEALALPVAERAGWLAGRADAERDFVPQLQALLARAAMETDTFMRRPAAAALDELAEVEGRSDAAGDPVGPYRLLQPLGEGGMATVWLAERADGALTRQVALKLPRHAWSANLAQRMARERDLLAALEHPNIARLYDAGVTEAGRPWLAMERITGIAIDAYCDRERLGIEARLKLLLQVCDALSHAHGRLIVHRDLKPANILVTEGGEVRLLDFGVGKLLQEEGAAGSHLTQMIGNALTPDYASPEQVAGKPVTVATDVYSLGVVMYELLTGQRPYRLGRQSTAALEEAILAADVPRASARASDKARARALRGDLDAVLAKALAKNPARRYGSVESLASDLRAHLRCEPVSAQAPGWRYRTAKFVQRNFAVLAVSGSVGLILAASAAVTAWQAVALRKQVALAQARAQQKEGIADFSTSVLTEVMRNGESLSLDQIVQRAEELVDRSPGKGTIERAVAANVVAGWLYANGHRGRAERLLDHVLADQPPGAAPSATAELRCLRALLRSSSGKLDEAKAEIDAVLGAVRDDPAATSDCLQRRAFLLRNGGRAPAEALESALAALASFEASGRRSARQRALLEDEIASALMINGRPDEARRRLQGAIALIDTAVGPESAAAAVLHNNVAVVLLEAGQPRQALSHIERASEISRQRSRSGEPIPFLASTRGSTLRYLGRCEEAVRDFATARALFARDGNFGSQIHALLGEAACWFEMGRPSELAARVQESLDLMARHGIPIEHRAVRGLALMQARVLQLQGRRAEAESAMRQAQQRYESAGARFATVGVLIARGELALERDLLDEADGLARAALEQGRGVAGDFARSLPLGEALVLQSRVHRAAGRVEMADAAVREGVEHLLATTEAGHPSLIRAREIMAATAALSSPARSSR